MTKPKKAPKSTNNQQKMKQVTDEVTQEEAIETLRNEVIEEALKIERREVMTTYYLSQKTRELIELL